MSNGPFPAQFSMRYVSGLRNLILVRLMHPPHDPGVIGLVVGRCE